MKWKQNIYLHYCFKHLLLAVFICLSVKAQSQIPNMDFENWETCIWRTQPVGWSTNGCGQFTSKYVLPDSMAYNGFLAMKLKNSGLYKPWAYTGFPITLHPYSLKGYVKFNLANTNDTVSVKIVLFNNSMAVDSGEWIGTSSISNYTQISIPITQSALTIDSAMVFIAGGNHLTNNQWGMGTDFWVDNLSLDFTNNIENIKKTESQFQLFPNPTEQYASLLFKGKKNTKVSIKLYDVNGIEIKTIWENQLSISQINMDLSYLSGGIYYLVFKTDKGTEVKKLIKQ